MIAFDHTFNVPVRITHLDTAGTETFSPFGALHGWCNEIGFLGSLTVTRSTSSKERQVIGQNIKDRHEQRGLSFPVAFGDNCCKDSGWLRQAMPSIKVYLDTFHLLQRYSEGAGRQDHQRHEVFMDTLGSIIAGPKEQRTTDRSGDQIYKTASEFIKRFSRQEEKDNVPASKRIVTENLLRVHANQRQHYETCFPPVGFQNFTVNRCGQGISTKGTNKLESFWRFAKSIFPSHAGLDLSMCMLLLIVSSWNLSREMMYDAR